MKICENPVLYGVLAVGFAFLPKLSLASEILSCVICAVLYSLINKKIMPVKHIFAFAAVFAAALMFVSAAVLYFQILKQIIGVSIEPFAQIIALMPVSFFIGIFIFYPISLVTYGVLVLFQGRHHH